MKAIDPAPSLDLLQTHPGKGAPHGHVACDFALRVGGPHNLRGSGHQGAIPGLTAVQRGFCQLGFGNIASDGAGTNNFSVLVADRTDGDVDMDSPSILAQTHGFAVRSEEHTSE